MSLRKEKISHNLLNLSLLEVGRRKSYTGFTEPIWGEKCDHRGVPAVPARAERRKANIMVLDFCFWCLDLTYSSNSAILSRKLECIKATEISDISKFAVNLQGLWKAV